MSTGCQASRVQCMHACIPGTLATQEVGVMGVAARDTPSCAAGSLGKSSPCVLSWPAGMSASEMVVAVAVSACLLARLPAFRAVRRATSVCVYHGLTTCKTSACRCWPARSAPCRIGHRRGQDGLPCTGTHTVTSSPASVHAHVTPLEQLARCRPGCMAGLGDVMPYCPAAAAPHGHGPEWLARRGRPAELHIDRQAGTQFGSSHLFSAQHSHVQGTPLAPPSSVQVSKPCTTGDRATLAVRKS